MSNTVLAGSTAIINGRKVKSARGETLSPEDMSIVNALFELKDSMDLLHSNLDSVTDSVLIDSYVYELKAAHMKYQYYLTLCKERGIVSAGFN
jgi:hypothetical protein